MSGPNPVTPITEEPIPVVTQKNESFILEDFPEIQKKYKIIIDVLLLTFFSTLAFTLGMIYLSDYVTALTDGGYYELQTGNFVNYGELYYETPVLLFLFTALFTVISGSTTFGVTFSASLFFAAAVVTNYFAAKITWNRKVATLTLPFSALSTILFRLSTDFMKNLLALVFVPMAIACFSRFHLKREWKYFVLSIVFSILTMSTHLMTSLALTVCLVGYFVIFHIISSLEEKKIDWKRLLFSAILLLSIAAGMGLIWLFNEYAIPVKETYWNYSSNTLPDGSSSSYTPGDSGFILPLSVIFNELPTFECILLVFGLVFAIVTLAIKPSNKERNAIIMLFSMLLPIWLLAISLDVNGWVQRMSQDLASFLILASAFTIGYIIKGFEYLVRWIEKKIEKIKITKIKPKISFTITVAALLVLPLIFPNIAVGRTLEPVITTAGVEDLQELRGKLPSDDSLIYAMHGLEYWVSHLSGYQCQKLSEGYGQIEDLYELLEGNTYDTYLLTELNNLEIPVVIEGTGPFSANTFTLLNPINDSVQTNPTVISCLTAPTSNVFQMHYYLYEYRSMGLLSNQNMNPFILVSGDTEWNFTLPTNLPPTTYQMEIEAQSNVGPGSVLVERIKVIFHPIEPAFKTVYIGKQFAVVENNPSYVLPPIPLTEADNNNQEEQKTEETTNYGVLTFPLMIRFPFLTNYLHYYFVIPLTLAYWSLIIFGTYRTVRLITNVKRKDMQTEEKE